MKRISIKGIALGAIATIILDLIVAVVLMIIFGGHVFKSGMPAQQMAEALTAVARGNDFLIASLILGTLTTVVGGYIAARIAKKEIYLNSGIVGIIGMVLGVFLGGQSPMWFNAAGFLTTVPAALAGGYLAKLRQSKDA
jgi:hypothetical protein